MSNYKKNHFSGHVNPFFSNKDQYYDRMMNNINNSAESNLLSPLKSRKVFKGIILSGKQLGKISPTDSGYIINDAELVDFGDGVSRWKFKFTIEEGLYDTDIGIAFSALYGRSPLESGITEAERAYRISRMPSIYTEAEHKHYSSLGFGSIIDVTQRHGVYFLSSHGGEVQVISNTSSNVFRSISTNFGGKAVKNIKAGKYVRARTHYDSSTMTLASSNDPAKRKWWLEILEVVIAEGYPFEGKACKSGKKYYDFCAADGGNIGVAHWAGGSIKRLINEMVKDYGKKTVEKWFDGKTIRYIKKHVKRCTMNKKRYGSQVKGEDDPSLVYTDCKKKLAWYSNGVKRFVSEFNGGEERRAKMVEVQRRTWFLKHVKKAITEMKRCGWPMNMRNAAIALGIINSNGHIGRGKSRWSGDPEALMDKYVFTHRSPRHAGGRMAIVQKKYPIVTPRVRADFSPIKY